MPRVSSRSAPSLATKERSMATEESKLKGARGEKQKQTNEARLR